MVTIFLFFLILTNIWQPVCHLMLFLNSVTHSLLSNSLKKGFLDEEIVGSKQDIFPHAHGFKPWNHWLWHSTFSSSVLWHDDIKSGSHLSPFLLKKLLRIPGAPLLEIQSCLPCLLVGQSFEHGPMWAVICFINQLKLSVITSPQWVWFPTQVQC